MNFNDSPVKRGKNTPVHYFFKSVQADAMSNHPMKVKNPPINNELTWC